MDIWFLKAIGQRIYTYGHDLKHKNNMKQILCVYGQHYPSHIRFRLEVTKLGVLIPSLTVAEPGFFSQFGVAILQSLNNADVSSTFVVMDSLSACTLKCSIKTIPGKETEWIINNHKILCIAWSPGYWMKPLLMKP